MMVKRIYITKFINNISSTTHTRLQKQNWNASIKYTSTDSCKTLQRYKNFNFFVNKIIPANHAKSTNTILSKRFKAIKDNINMIQRYDMQTKNNYK